MFKKKALIWAALVLVVLIGAAVAYKMYFKKGEVKVEPASSANGPLGSHAEGHMVNGVLVPGWRLADGRWISDKRYQQQ